MAYSTFADIQMDFPAVDFVTASSRLKQTQIDQFIVDADALIDTYLAARYVTPVTATISVKVLRLYSRSLVADKIKGILEIKQQTSQGANQNVRTGLSTKDVIAQLEEYRDGTAMLSDAALVLANGGLSSFNVKNAKKPEFEKDTDSW